MNDNKETGIGETSAEQIAARRLEQIPVLYRPLYLRAIRGQVGRRDAITAMCMECMGWVRKQVAQCSSPACPLFRFRPFKARGQGGPTQENTRGRS